MTEKHINRCLQSKYITHNFLLRLRDETLNERLLAFTFFFSATNISRGPKTFPVISRTNQ